MTMTMKQTAKIRTASLMTMTKTLKITTTQKDSFEKNDKENNKLYTVEVENIQSHKC